MWSTEDYPLHDLLIDDEPVVLTGIRAAAARALDAMDPVAPGKSVNFTDGTTIEELEFFMKGCYVRWCDSLGKCVIGSVGNDLWTMKDAAYLQRLVEQFISARIAWAEDQIRRHPDEKTLKAYLKFAVKQSNISKHKMFAASLREVLGIDVSELDTEPMALGTPSGVFSLDDGRLFFDIVTEENDALSLFGNTTDYEDPWERSRPMHITKRVNAPVNSRFEEWEEDPRWTRFIDEICDGDSEKAAFLQRALGYSLLGGNPEKATFVLWGPYRDNGKSTLMNIVKHALGDYADSAPTGIILKNRFENYKAANPALAKLVGKRLVDLSEPSMGDELNGAMVKKLASGTDEVSTRFLHKDEFSFVPEFTLWLHCNALPLVFDPTAIDVSHMFVIPFTRSFKGDERDFTLVDRFKTDRGMATVMHWLLDGFYQYQERGLAAPKCVTDATEAWLVTSGTWIGRFIEERCALDPTQRCEVKVLQEAAKEFCASEFDDSTYNTRELNTYLRTLSVVNKCSNGERHYRGIKLLSAPERKTGKRKRTLRLGSGKLETS